MNERPTQHARRQFLFALSACAVGVVIAAFLISLSKHIPEFLSASAAVNYVASVNSAVAHAVSPAQTQALEQTLENLDEDVPPSSPASSSSASAPILKPHIVTAGQYLVIDITGDPLGATTTTPFVLSSRTILEKDSSRSLPIASLTKLVTAVIAENIFDRAANANANANTPIEITPRILATDGNTAAFRNGEEFTADELLYPLLMVSSNDAAEALAEADPQGRAAFIKSMNQWVNSIGAYNTYFADPSGLSPENVSSANDLAIIIRWIYENRPDLIAITDTKVKSFRIHTWTNPTQLLNFSDYVGGKNGYIPESGETAVSLFKTSNKLFAVVLLDSTDRDQDVLELMREATGAAYITYAR
jgi:D-alanyl-D-alanine endopeptidase (penicillin-binding protein 7)